MANLSRLPKAVIESYEWQYEGSCTHLPVEVFFLPENARGPEKRAHEEQAKAVCASCPVLERCRSHSLAVREPYGVWGGLSADERFALLAAQDEAVA